MGVVVMVPSLSDLQENRDAPDSFSAAVCQLSCADHLEQNQPVARIADPIDDPYALLSVLFIQVRQGCHRRPLSTGAQTLS
jgi:hypothetical protein